jgi:uncharacterized HAD superfamily protein
MKIGIDIDDTITLSNELLVKEALIFDKKYLKGKGFKDKNKYWFSDMMYWDKDDTERFFDYVKENDLLLKVRLRRGARKYINMLHDNGHEIYLITSRPETNDMRNKIIKYMNDKHVHFDDVINDCKNKGIVANRLGLDYFIDNLPDHIHAVRQYGIKSYLIEDAYKNYNDGMEAISSWKKIYELIEGETDE